MLSVGGIGAGRFDGRDRQSKEVAYVIIVLAILMGAFSFLANKKHLYAIGTLLFAGLLSVISIKWFNDAKSLGATFGIGLIMYLVGSILGLVSAVIGFMKK